MELLLGPVRTANADAIADDRVTPTSRPPRNGIAMLDTLADNSRHQNRRIGHDEHPVADRPAVHDETDAGRDPTGEQPRRYAFGRILAPLHVDLP
jgi:hypothetical protein